MTHVLCILIGAQSQPPPIVVANTHILFNTKRGEVKLAQVGASVTHERAVEPDFSYGYKSSLFWIIPDIQNSCETACLESVPYFAHNYSTSAKDFSTSAVSQLH